MAAFILDFQRATVFRGMMPWPARRSNIETVVLNSAFAFSLSPAVIAARTCLIWVRIIDRRPALRARLFSFWRALFRDCAVLAKFFILGAKTYKNSSA